MVCQVVPVGHLAPGDKTDELGPSDLYVVSSQSQVPNFSHRTAEDPEFICDKALLLYATET